MEQKETDLRYQKTEKLIRRVFREMIQEMEYEQITIKELTRRAEINRKTFYLHYSSLDVLLAQLQIEILEPLLQATINLKFPDDVEDAVRIWFQFAASLGETEGTILGSQGAYPPDKNPWEYAISHSCDFFECFSAHPLEKRLITAYWCGSYRDIFLQWVTDGRQTPIEDIIRLFCQLMSQGLCNIRLE